MLGFLVTIGYAVVYTGGIVLSNLLVWGLSELLHLQDITLVGVLGWTLGIFIVAPGLAIGYHNLVKQED